MLRRAINGCPCVRACARLSVYSWCIVVWGNRFEGGRERERESATDERRRMDGRTATFCTGEERERERRTSRVFSCITSSPQTAPLLLPDITSLISRSARRNILRRGSRFSKRLPFHPSGNSFNCLERSRALLSLSLSLSSLPLVSLPPVPSEGLSYFPPFLFLFSLSHPNPLSASEMRFHVSSGYAHTRTRTRIHTAFPYRFRVSFFFFQLVSERL